jgi:hypothetical protein
LVFVVARRWLPPTAGYAGLALGVLMLGTIGILGGAPNPDNTDFEILEPTWLALTLIALTALLAGTTFAAVAARLETGFRRIAYASYVVLLVPILAAGGVIYLGIRTFFSGVLRSDRARRTVLMIGRIVVGLAVTLAAANTVRVIVDIAAD